MHAQPTSVTDTVFTTNNTPVYQHCTVAYCDVWALLTANNLEKSSMVFCLGASDECNLSMCSMISREVLPASSGGIPTAIACSAHTEPYVHLHHTGYQHGRFCGLQKLNLWIKEAGFSRPDALPISQMRQNAEVSSKHWYQPGKINQWISPFFTASSLLKEAVLHPLLQLFKTPVVHLHIVTWHLSQPYLADNRFNVSTLTSTEQIKNGQSKLAK